MAQVKYPVDTNAEMAVLGAVLLKPEILREIKYTLTPTMFSNGKLGHLYSLILELDKEGKPIDIICLADKLKNNGGLEPYGGAEGITRILDVPSSANLPAYAGIVRRNYYFKLIIDNAGCIQETAEKGEEGLFEVITEATKLFKELAIGAKPPNISLSKVARMARERIKMKRDVIPFGHGRLDDVANMMRRNPTIIGGRTANLKTTFYTDRIPWWIGMGYKILVLSYEVSSDMLFRSIASKAARLDANILRQYALEEEALSQFIRVCEELQQEWEGKLCIMDKSDGIKSLEVVESITRTFKPDILIVDYIGLMPTGKQYRRLEVEDNFHFVCDLCTDVDAVPIIVSQIRRQNTKFQEDNPYPKLDELKEAGGLEENAHLVLLMYYPYQQTHSDKDKHKIRIELAKNKYGPLGTWYFYHVPKYREIIDLGFNRFDEHAIEVQAKSAAIR